MSTHYLVEEIPDKSMLLQSLLDHMSKRGNKLVQVIWRERQGLYVVIHSQDEPDVTPGRPR